MTRREDIKRDLHQALKDAFHEPTRDTVSSVAWAIANQLDDLHERLDAGTVRVLPVLKPGERLFIPLKDDDAQARIAELERAIEFQREDNLVQLRIFSEARDEAKHENRRLRARVEELERQAKDLTREANVAVDREEAAHGRAEKAEADVRRLRADLVGESSFARTAIEKAETERDRLAAENAALQIGWDEVTGDTDPGMVGPRTNLMLAAYALAEAGAETVANGGVIYGTAMDEFTELCVAYRTARKALGAGEVE